MSLIERDKKHLWHPLTQHGLNPEHIAIVKAEGCLLYDEAGNSYIDAISSWYTSMYGHCNKYITDRVSEQMKQLDQIVFSGFTHRPAIELSEKLIEILPDNQNRIFFSDNGSTTVEVAIKMAIQYHFNREEKRNVLIAFEDGFHGDTFGAMSVSGLSVYNGPFKDFFLEVKRIPVPSEDNLVDVLRILEEITETDKVAAFIYEPLVQGAAAMKMHIAEDLDKILKFLRKKNVLLIADEVMTGFGKSGKPFASDHIETKPDLICLSKALTAGLLPMGITSCSEKIYNAFLSEKVEDGFFHGHTYSANPLACSAAIAGIELLTSYEIQDNIVRIIASHDAFKDKVAHNPNVKSVRQTGVILAIDLNFEIDRYGNLRDRIYKFFMESGIYLRPLGNTIYIQPPYIITDEQLDKVYKVIESSLDKF